MRVGIRSTVLERPRDSLERRARMQQQIAKVHHVAPRAHLAVGRVHLVGHATHETLRALEHHLGVVGIETAIPPRVDPLANDRDLSSVLDVLLPLVAAVMAMLGIAVVVVQRGFETVPVPHLLLHDGVHLLRLQDRELRAQAVAIATLRLIESVPSQEVHAQRMKRPDAPQATLFDPAQSRRSFPHLGSRLACEGEGEDLLGRNAVVSDDVGDPRGEGLGLARPRGGENQERRTSVRRDLQLGLVETPQK